MFGGTLAAFHSDGPRGLNFDGVNEDWEVTSRTIPVDFWKTDLSNEKSSNGAGKMQQLWF